MNTQRPSTALGKHTCPQCSRSFLSAPYLTQHISHTHSQSSVPLRSTPLEQGKSGEELFVCGVCETKWKRADGLWDHIRIAHLQLPSNLRHCPICAQLVSQKELKTHLEQLHPEIYCQLCHAVFQGFTTYNAHFNFTHNKDVHVSPVTAKCGICLKDFPTGAYLMYHILARHQGLTGRTVCQYCGEVLRFIEERAHRKALHYVVPCLHCGKLCKAKRLSQHLNFMHS